MKKFYTATLTIILLIGSITAQKAEYEILFNESYIKKTMREALDWQLQHPKHKLYSWTNGAFYAGVFAAYETLEDKNIYNAIYAMGESNKWKPGPDLHNADDHAICQTYIDMYRISGEKKMIQPFIETMEEFMATPFESYEGWEDIATIIWWWCDALFMGPPALVKLGVTVNDDKYLKLNDQLFKECYNLLYDKEEHLYARDIRYKWNEPDFEKLQKANGKKIFWSRGNGWVMGGLVRILVELPKDWPTRDFFIQNYKEMAEKIISLQQDDGLWRASLLDPNSYPGGEASGSGFFTYALAWGINNGILDKDKYLPSVKKAWIGLNSLIQPDGRVGWVQPIGADPRQNFSAESWEVYGTGAFLLAGSEVIKLFINNSLSVDFMGQSLPYNWRPFNDESPWNSPITSNALVHQKSKRIIEKMQDNTNNIRFGNLYLIPLWVVNYDSINHYPAKASYPFDIWDCNNDFITDINIPLDYTMWGEQTEDGHIIIIDTVFNLSWEMSRFTGIINDTIRCSTFNVWDLKGSGTGDPDEGNRWRSRGGRGSGFPNIAGLIRPEEIQSGEIRHALAFTYGKVKKNEFYYPACRSDGWLDEPDVPAEGMLFQLNPQLTDSDFEEWGLSEGAKVVAKALQEYGMYLCDAGGDFALQLQLLDRDSKEHRKKWDEIAPGLYSSITNIPVNQFRLIDTGNPVTGGAMDVVTTPLIIPQCGTFRGKAEITIKVNQIWPNAKIRYTLDGTTPTESSSLYTGPFTISKSSEIKAVAYDKSGKKSHVMRAPVKIIDNAF
jgi:rhamnogalacturonyl hydrolase YesR